jgi:hypothetical protein
VAAVAVKEQRAAHRVLLERAVLAAAEMGQKVLLREAMVIQTLAEAEVGQGNNFLPQTAAQAAPVL